MPPKRAIFQEVAGNETAGPPRAGGIDRQPKGARRAIRLWLMGLFALVCAMIVVGGMTRLTDSGLSITEWRPVVGAIPPLSAEMWAEEFDKYRQIDQYALLNQDMSLAEFKVIYWWEWGHRQLGRVIGLVWALGFVAFWASGRIPTGWTPRLLALGALGGLQGAIGWWMVASGLADGMVAVASYRLATHLGLAFVILGLIAWYTFLLNRPAAELLAARRAREDGLVALTGALVVASFGQIILGALVAGIDAGRGYTDWPLMNGAVVPTDIAALEPAWRNLFENPATTQFLHRVAGYLLAAFGAVVWWRGRRSAHGPTRAAFNTMAVVLLAQVVLGVITVLYAAPWQLGIAHQATAVLLWVLILRARHLARYPRFDSLRGGARA